MCSTIVSLRYVFVDDRLVSDGKLTDFRLERTMHRINSPEQIKPLLKAFPLRMTNRCTMINRPNRHSPLDVAGHQSARMPLLALLSDDGTPLSLSLSLSIGPKSNSQGASPKIPCANGHSRGRVASG